MCKFGLEITPVSSGTTCPESLAQYDRNIHITQILCSLSLLVANGEYMRRWAF